ncbi:MAG: hypothetical protein M1603_00760 [Candidatus Marsarchaeota archaeon]|jgi:hypothetical protein|nr:hypothetical protein [Candidatus Marsarchaeota archaeon]
MKVFIVSDSKRNGIALANMVNASGNIGIISESDVSEPQQIVSELESHKDSFRLAFVVTDKPIYTCTEVNKSDKMRAAVCSNPRDVEEAKEALANVIVLRNSSFQKMDIGSIISASTGKDIPQLEGSQDSLSSKRKPQKAQKKQKADEDEDEEDSDYKGDQKAKQKGKGIFGKLKDSLGIDE